MVLENKYKRKENSINLLYRSSRGQTVREYLNRFKDRGIRGVKKYSSPKSKRVLATSKGKFLSPNTKRVLVTSKGKLPIGSSQTKTISEYVETDLKTDNEYGIRKNNYPALGFKFKVTSTLSDIGGDGLFDVSDSFFQSISGIKATAGESVIVNSGFNNSQYKLPTGTTYPDLILTRGLIRKSSSFGQWCYDFLIKQGQQFDKIKTRTITVMLLGEKLDDILMEWSFYNCYPKELEIGAFNADKSEIAIETLTMAYSYLSKN